MNAIVQLLVKHGYSVLFASVFARQMCLPVPAILFLIGAGALAGAGRMTLAVALGLALIACLLADMVWDEAGRRGGDQIPALHLWARSKPRRRRSPVEGNVRPTWASDSHARQVRRRTGRGNASLSGPVRYQPAPLPCL